MSEKVTTQPAAETSHATEEYIANEGKNLTIEVAGKSYARIPVKTHIITQEDSLEDVFETYVKEKVQPGDIVFVSEKAVSCTQHRAVRLDEIEPRWLATQLSKLVYKNPYGIGLAMPETMEMAFREVGTPRILLASAVSAIGKLFGQRGWFYRVAGSKAREIDGPCDYTLPPYNEYVVLGPDDPEKEAKKAAAVINVPVAVVDLNDLGGNILGISDSTINIDWLLEVVSDNPLGQGSEMTPIGIIRAV